jgi:hypothetical protein
MVVFMALSETGSVCAASIVRSDMPDYMNSCVLRTLSTAAYPAPEGGCVQVNIPLSFVPPDGGSPKP